MASKSARKMQCNALPVFIVPRYGRIEFFPQGDVPLRKTRIWRVRVEHYSPTRETVAPYMAWYPAKSDGSATPYPTTETALFYMLQACAVADECTKEGNVASPNHYWDTDTIPPFI